MSKLLRCNVDFIDNITKGGIYKKVRASPSKEMVLIVNDNDDKEWFSERFFNKYNLYYNQWIEYNEEDLTYVLEAIKKFSVKVLMDFGTLQFGMFSLIYSDYPLCIYYPERDRYEEIDTKPKRIMIIRED